MKPKKQTSKGAPAKSASKKPKKPSPKKLLPSDANIESILSLLSAANSAKPAANGACLLLTPGSAQPKCFMITPEQCAAIKGTFVGGKCPPPSPFGAEAMMAAAPNVGARPESETIIGVVIQEAVDEAEGDSAEVRLFPSKKLKSFPSGMSSNQVTLYRKALNKRNEIMPPGKALMPNSLTTETTIQAVAVKVGALWTPPVVINW